MSIRKVRHPHTILLDFYKGDWHQISAILLYGIGIGIFSLVIPIAAQSLVNSIASSGLLQPLIVLTSAVTFFLFASCLFKTIQLCISEKLARRFMAKIALDLAHEIPLLDYDNFKESYGNHYLNRFMEIVNIQKSTSIMLLEASAVLFQITFGLVLLALYHPYFLVFSILIAIILILTAVFFERGAVRTSMTESDNKYAILSWLEDIGANHPLFKSLHGKTYAQQRMDQLVLEYIYSRRDHFKYLISQHILVMVVQVLGSGLLLGVGGWLVMKSQLSLGQLVAAEIIFTVVVQNSDKLTKIFATFYDLVTSTTKLELLLNLPKEESQQSKITPKDHNDGYAIDFKEVSFFSNAGGKLLDSISMKVPAGKNVLVYGESGSGKSILADLILGFKFPSSGSVEIDGFSTMDADLLSTRDHIALVRNIEIIHGTIEENLAFGSPTDVHKIRAVLSSLDLLKNIESFDEGLQTPMEGNNSFFSLGQAQRLMIARAILRNPKVIILDSALDVIDDGMISSALEAIRVHAPHATIIALTREKSAFDYFERVYSLSKNGFVEVR